jgi:predicted MFS family arabinose efflux permease
MLTGRKIPPLLLLLLPPPHLAQQLSLQSFFGSIHLLPRIQTQPRGATGAPQERLHALSRVLLVLVLVLLVLLRAAMAAVGRCRRRWHLGGMHLVLLLLLLLLLHLLPFPSPNLLLLLLLLLLVHSIAV